MGDGVIGVVLAEGDLDVPGGEALVGGLDGGHAVLEEGLVVPVEHDLGEAAAVESHPGVLAEDDAGQEQVVEDGVVDGRERPAVGPLLGLSELDPPGLDGPGGHDEHGGLESLLEFGDQLAVVGLQGLEVVVGHEDDERLLLALGGAGHLDDFGDGEALEVAVGALELDQILGDRGLDVGEGLR